VRPNANQKLDYTATGDFGVKALRQTRINTTSRRCRLASNEAQHHCRLKGVYGFNFHRVFPNPTPRNCSINVEQQDCSVERRPEQVSFEPKRHPISVVVYLASLQPDTR
jgi:hypothetical protein